MKIAPIVIIGGATFATVYREHHEPHVEVHGPTVPDYLRARPVSMVSSGSTVVKLVGVSAVASAGAVAVSAT